MNRSKHSNPLNANPGTGSSSMSPSPSSESVKGSANRGNTPSATTRDTKSATNVGPDHVKGDVSKDTEQEKLKRGSENERSGTVHGERRAG
jgi:hypothetical protein